MRRALYTLLCLPVLFGLDATAQDSKLSIKKIMQDPDTWIGPAPGTPFYDVMGDAFVYWNPKGEYQSDSLFRITERGKLEQLTVETADRPRARFQGWHSPNFSTNKTRFAFESGGDIYVSDLRDKRTTQITSTTASESVIRISPDGERIYYSADNNVFMVDLTTASTIQLTDIRSGKKRETEDELDDDSFLVLQQETLFEAIATDKEEEERKKAKDAIEERLADKPTPFYFGKSRVSQLGISPDGRWVSFVLTPPVDNERTEVQNYVTEDGWAETLSARSKVGAKQVGRELYLQDTEADTTFAIDLKQLPGAMDRPFDNSPYRTLRVYGPLWSADARHAVAEVRSTDGKERWIVEVNPERGTAVVLDRQSDEAWIAGPGISWFGGQGRIGWLPDNKHFYYQSEATGYSHLYTVNVETGKKTAITEGGFEVSNPILSQNGKTWFFTSSEASPHEKHVFSVSVNGGARSQLTTMPGNNQLVVSPNERDALIRYSYANQPPELYAARLESPTALVTGDQLTQSTTKKWREYPWRDPEIISITASDGAEVPARLYAPENPNGAAVLFVHGAGYLQNVHKWWSSYFREYMFHNLLADEGYVVLDVDYRGSAGYGRDWRTAIYRHMGGRDLQDYVDASTWVGQEYGIDPERVFIYGGSYGGFITLMALFTEPEHFGGGAALRAVTDWAHYNHGYTSNILNTPEEDPESFIRSSPIYFAGGLEDPLLIAHGVIDTNVQYQDVIRLAQRLIELGKTDWELASYPVEGHGFTEPSSWTDEYRRILKLIRDSVGPK